MIEIDYSIVSLTNLSEDDMREKFASRMHQDTLRQDPRMPVKTSLEEKREAAIKWLREESQRGYLLDQQVPRKA